MKLTVLELDDSYRQKYETFINLPEHLEHVMFYHSWEWGNFLRSTAKDFIRIGIFDGSVLVATAQASLVAFRGGVFWYIPRGLVVDYKSKKLVKSVHEAASIYFRNKSGAAFMRVDPNIVKGSKEVAPIDELGAKKAGLFIQAQRVWLTDTQLDEESQMNWLKEHGMRKRLPTSIRKGLREGVTMRVSSEPKDLELFIKLLNQLDSRKGGIGKKPDDYYRKQFDAMAPSGYEKLFIAEKDGKPLVINLIALFGKEASYLHGASLDEDRQLAAPFILHVKSMVYARVNHPSIERYNFWGVVSKKNSVKSNPHNGYAEFKKSFGGYEVEYIDPRDFVYNQLKWKMCWAIEKYRKKKSKKD
jgi:lipid II:glycine glycyltransferase (peptidoglycan interpeptide bridge formation enzyme)